MTSNIFRMSSPEAGTSEPAEPCACPSNCDEVRQSKIANQTVLSFIWPPRLPLSVIIQRRDPQKPCRPTQLLFNAQQLVVLRNAVRPRSRPGLDLPRSRGHRQVCNECILALAG